MTRLGAAALRETAHRDDERTSGAAGGNFAYEVDSLAFQILDAITDRMRDLDMSQQQLAKKLGVSEGRVSQLLSGNQNLTLRTLANLAVALDGHFDLTLSAARTGTPAPAPQAVRGSVTHT